MAPTPRTRVDFGGTTVRVNCRFANRLPSRSVPATPLRSSRIDPHPVTSTPLRIRNPPPVRGSLECSQIALHRRPSPQLVCKSPFAADCRINSDVRKSPFSAGYPLRIRNLPSVRGSLACSQIALHRRLNAPTESQIAFPVDYRSESAICFPCVARSNVRESLFTADRRPSRSPTDRKSPFTNDRRPNSSSRTSFLHS